MQFEFDEKRINPSRFKVLNKQNLRPSSSFEMVDLAKMMYLYPLD